MYFAKLIARYYLLWFCSGGTERHFDLKLEDVGIDLKKQKEHLELAYQANRIIQTDPQRADMALECEWTLAKMEVHYMMGNFFEAMEAGNIEEMKMVSEFFNSLADRWMDVMEAYDNETIYKDKDCQRRVYTNDNISYWEKCESKEGGCYWIEANIWYKKALIKRAEFNLALKKGDLAGAQQVFSDYSGDLKYFKSVVETPSYHTGKTPGGVLMNLGKYMDEIGVRMQYDLFQARFMSGDEDKFAIWQECKEFWGPMAERYESYREAVYRDLEEGSTLRYALRFD